MKISLAFFITVLVFARCSGQAPESNSKLKWGIRAGFTVASIHSKDKEVSGTEPVSGNSRVGVMGGMYVQVPFTKTLQFQPELLVVGKGSKARNDYYYYSNRLTYLEMPMNFLYKPVNSKGSFFFGGGPAPALFIGNNSYYNGNSYFKAFDLGINLLSGYEWSIGFSIQLHYTHGLLIINRLSNDENEARNRCLGVSLGYTF